MTIHECKKDAATRLADAGIKFRKLSVLAVSFGGFGFAVFVRIHEPDIPAGLRRKEIFQDVPAPNKGGYIVEWSN